METLQSNIIKKILDDKAFCLNFKKQSAIHDLYCFIFFVVVVFFLVSDFLRSKQRAKGGYTSRSPPKSVPFFQY